MIENVDFLLKEGFNRDELNHVFGTRLVDDVLGPCDDTEYSVSDTDCQIEELKQRLSRAHRKIERLEKTIKGYEKVSEKLARAEAYIKNRRSE